MKDNIVNKNLQYHLFHDYKFTNTDLCLHFANDIKTVYAKQFCNNDFVKAKRLLEKNTYTMKQTDVAILSFMLGGIFIFVVFMLFLYVLEGEIFETALFWDSLKASTPIMRFTFMMCYVLIGVGIAISVYRRNEINYMHIFQLDEKHRVG